MSRTEQTVAQIPLVEDQIREYRQNQRTFYNARQALRRIGTSLTGRRNASHTIEQQIGISNRPLGSTM